MDVSSAIWRDTRKVGVSFNGSDTLLVYQKLRRCLPVRLDKQA